MLYSNVSTQYPKNFPVNAKQAGWLKCPGYLMRQSNANNTAIAFKQAAYELNWVGDGFARHKRFMFSLE